MYKTVLKCIMHDRHETAVVAFVADDDVDENHCRQY